MNTTSGLLWLMPYRYHELADRGSKDAMKSRRSNLQHSPECRSEPCRPDERDSTIGSSFE